MITYKLQGTQMAIRAMADDPLVYRPTEETPALAEWLFLPSRRDKWPTGTRGKPCPKCHGTHTNLYTTKEYARVLWCGDCGLLRHFGGRRPRQSNWDGVGPRGGDGNHWRGGRFI